MCFGNGQLHVKACSVTTNSWLHKTPFPRLQLAMASFSALPGYWQSSVLCKACLQVSMVAGRALIPLQHHQITGNACLWAAARYMYRPARPHAQNGLRVKPRSQIQAEAITCTALPWCLRNSVTRKTVLVATGQGDTCNRFRLQPGKGGRLRVTGR